MRAETKSLGWKEITYLIFGAPDAEEAEILLENGQKIALKRCFEADSARIVYDLAYRKKQFTCLGELQLFSVILSILEKSHTQKIMFYTKDDRSQYLVEILFIPAEE